MSQKEDNREFTRLMFRAYIMESDGRLHTGEALMLACLVHTKAVGRKGKDMLDLQKIMKDHNRKINK